MSAEAIRAELMRRWRERVCDGNPDGAEVGEGAALLFVEMIMDAHELFTRNTFDRFTPITPILPWPGDERDDFQRAVLGSITNSGATFSQPMVLLGAVHTAGMRLHELGLVGANAAGFYPLTDHAPAAPSPTPKPLTTEARAVLVAWLPGYDDPIAWWHDDSWDAILDALADENRAMRRQYLAADDESYFRAAVRIEAVKP